MIEKDSYTASCLIKTNHDQLVSECIIVYTELIAAEKNSNEFWLRFLHCLENEELVFGFFKIEAKDLKFEKVLTQNDPYLIING